MIDRLLRDDTTADELIVIRDALLKHVNRDVLTQRLWAMLGPATDSLDARRYRIAAALALFDPNHPAWQGISRSVARQLTGENPLSTGAWCEAFQPVRSALMRPLLETYNDRLRDSFERSVAFAVLVDFAVQPGNIRRDEELADLLGASVPSTFDRVLGLLSDRQTARRYLHQQLSDRTNVDAAAFAYRRARIATASSSSASQTRPGACCARPQTPPLGPS